MKSMKTWRWKKSNDWKEFSKSVDEKVVSIIFGFAGVRWSGFRNPGGLALPHDVWPHFKNLGLELPEMYLNAPTLDPLSVARDRPFRRQGVPTRVQHALPPPPPPERDTPPPFPIPKRSKHGKNDLVWHLSSFFFVFGYIWSTSGRSEV